MFIVHGLLVCIISNWIEVDYLRECIISNWSGRFKNMAGRQKLGAQRLSLSVVYPIDWFIWCPSTLPCCFHGGKIWFNGSQLRPNDSKDPSKKLVMLYLFDGIAVIFKDCSAS